MGPARRMRRPRNRRKKWPIAWPVRSITASLPAASCGYGSNRRRSAKCKSKCRRTPARSRPESKGRLRAPKKTLLDNISMLHDAIGQTGATVGRIEIEVAPQQQNANDANQRDGGSGREQKDSGTANSQNTSNKSGGGQQQQNSGGRTNATIDEIDIDI